MNCFLMIKRKTLIIFFVTLLAVMFFFSVLSKGETDKQYLVYACYVSLFITGYLAVVNRKNIIMFFVYLCITYFNYSFMWDRYFIGSTDMDILFNQCADSKLYTIAISITLLFSMVLFFIDGLWGQHKKDYSDIFLSKKSQPLVVYILLALIEVYAVFSGAAFEYGAINVAVAFMYVGNNKRLRYIILVFTIVVFIQGVLNGLRVPVLPYLLCAGFMTFTDKINYKIMCIGLIFGIVFMTLMGIYGDHGGNYSLNVGDAIAKLSESGYSVDTSIFAFLQSFISLKVRELIDFSQRMELFEQFILSQFLGSGGFKYAKLSIFTRRYYVHYYGLIWPYAFYFYMGWFGVVVSGGILGAYINLLSRVKKESNEYCKVLLGYFVAMMPKWFLYEPTSLFRGIILLTVVYWGAKFISKILYKNDNITEMVVSTDE